MQQMPLLDIKYFSISFVKEKVIFYILQLCCKLNRFFLLFALGATKHNSERCILADDLISNPGLPDGIFSYQYPQFWFRYFGEPWIGKCWYILMSFGIFFNNLVYFMAFYSTLVFFVAIWYF
jgi:hypothetical protein